MVAWNTRASLPPLRWERQCQIRKDKFEKILPRAMRENGVDMWIVMQKENQFDPMYEDLGRGYVGSVGYYIFTDRGGDRIERAAPLLFLLECQPLLTHRTQRSCRSFHAFAVARVLSHLLECDRNERLVGGGGIQ